MSESTTNTTPSPDVVEAVTAAIRSEYLETADTEEDRAYMRALYDAEKAVKAALAALTPAQDDGLLGELESAATFGGEIGTFLIQPEMTERILTALRASNHTALLREYWRGAFNLDDRVTKKSGSSWSGKVVGFYSTDLTPEGYAVESENERGSVQIYPAQALTHIDQALAKDSVKGTGDE